MTLAGFPPPPARGIDLPGPFFLGFYPLVILAGIFLATWIATKLWRSRGGNGDDIFSAVFWTVLSGIVGARVYHVVTSPDPYFGPDGDLLAILRIWEGGISIIGAVMAGSVALWIFSRIHNIKLGAFTDAIVPGLILAQAIGRWGNWFNQELFGRVTDLPWGLRIDTDQEHQPLPSGASEFTTFHPTFLYESLWNLVGFALLLFLFKRFQFRRGLLTWTYVAYYALGRFWVESLRIDDFSKSTQFPLNDFGIEWRLNQIVAFIIFIVAFIVLVVLYAKRPKTAEAIAEEIYVYQPSSVYRDPEDGQAFDHQKQSMTAGDDRAESGAAEPSGDQGRRNERDTL